MSALASLPGSVILTASNIKDEIDTALEGVENAAARAALEKALEQIAMLNKLASAAIDAEGV